MKSENYKVTCKNCNQTGQLSITAGDNVMYRDHTPIISSRLRGDMQWGFECICGNNSLIAISESKDLNLLVQHPDPITKQQIITDIQQRLTSNNLFNMERI